MIKKNTLPTVIGIIVLIAGLGAGVLLVQFRQVFRLGASPDITPKDVRATNISDTSITVSWVTDKQTRGFITYGDTPSLGQTAQPTSNEESFVHSIDIANLSPSSSYFVKINSNGETFDNNGIPWEFKTGPTIPASAVSGVISGKIETATGETVKGVIVYVSSSSISPISTLTTESGNWVISQSSIRVSSLASYANIILSNPTLEIFVQGGQEGVASAQINGSAAESVPTIVLGQTHDFRSQQSGADGELPEASLSLPEDTTPSSGFDIQDATNSATASAQTVTLESTDQGEVITTTEPEFFGEGPPGTEIQITIQSDPIIDEIKVDSNGEWSWTPPEGLSEGTHTITLKWTDKNGILRSLTRNFEVQAAGGPAFESTPSASPKTSATPSAAPRKIIPSTSSAVPVSGVGMPTILGIGLGIILITTALLLAI